MSNENTITKPLEQVMEDNLNKSYELAIDHAINLVKAAVMYPVEGISGQFINKENIINKLNQLKKK